MNRNFTIGASLLAALLLATGAFYLGRKTSQPADASMAAASTTEGRKVLYWHDPMVPGPRFDKPGKSPFMDMQLVPVYADEQGGDAGVKVSPGCSRTWASARREGRADAGGELLRCGRRRAVRRAAHGGRADARERVCRAPVGSCADGVRPPRPAPRDRLRARLAGPQNEYLALKRSGVSRDLWPRRVTACARCPFPDALLRQSEQAGTAQARFTLTAPVSGVVQSSACGKASR
jgi:Cu(I)/Ag(I) efflux system membrane fusion protein